MATRLPFTDRELLDRFRETHPELSLYEIAGLSENEFVARYAESLQCDPWQARRVHRAAVEVKEKAALIWANLKDAASPYLRQTLFNNIPEEFLEHLQTIPGYDRLFGSLDFIECDHARSIFGPAAYFVDLMRFVETHITRNIPPDVSDELKLEQRRPDLAKISLDKNHTYQVIPSIDLVIEILEAIIRTRENPDAYQIIEEAGFPMNLPFNLPLAEIRGYLKQLKTHLHEIYQTFWTDQSSPDHLDREFLELSPREYHLISTEVTRAEDLAAYYGDFGLQPVFQLSQRAADHLRGAGLPAKVLDSLQNLKNKRFEGSDAGQKFLIHLENEIGPDDAAKYGSAILKWADRRLSKVQVFLDQTGLSRAELNDLIYQDLDRHEINAGLSRLFVINNVADGLGHLMIEQDPERPGDPTYDSESLVNLSPQKLDRIYRFLKLARRLGWSFADLDWAIRSLQKPYEPEKSLSFDGINDYVAARVSRTLVKDAFTVEAWVNPARHGLNPICAKGDAADQKNHQTHFLFWIDAEGRLAFYDQQLLVKGEEAYIRTVRAIPAGQFSHVAVTVSPDKEVKFYLNGNLAPTLQSGTLPAAPAAIGEDLEIGRNLGGHTFEGIIKEVRIWDTVRTEEQIKAVRYRHLAGHESHLVGYWPLVEDRSGRLLDHTINGNHGLPGGAGFAAQPRWVQRDLVLDALPLAMCFNGLDQFLGVHDIKGMDKPLADLTLEAWIKFVNTGREHPIIGKGSEKDNAAQFLLSINSAGRLVFTGASTDAFESEGVINPLVLTHVCVTVSEQAVQFYINGGPDKKHELTQPLALAPQGQDLVVGRNFGEAYFKGLIEEVRIWEVARTGDQIVRGKDQALTAAEYQGLAGYWQLDEIDRLTINDIPRAVAKDRSAYQNHLYLGGVLEDFMPVPVYMVDVPGATPVVTEGTALEFDGENDVITLFNSENAGLGQFERWTLMFWFKPALVDRPQRQQVLFMQGDAEAGLRIFIENGLKIAAWAGDYEAPVLTESVIAKDGLTAGQWYHLAISNDGTAGPDSLKLKAYLDGEYFDDITFIENFSLSSAGPAYLGGIGRALGQTRISGKLANLLKIHHLYHFAGQISDVRLWQVVKEDADIKRERYAAPDPTHPDLVLYLPLDEGQGLAFKGRSRPLDPCLPLEHEGRFQTRNVAFVTAGGEAELEDIYSHYIPDGLDVLGWQNYTYTGRMLLTDPNGGIGLTFYSRYPEKQARFYQLRRTQHQPAFHLTSHLYGRQGVLDSPPSGSVPDLQVNTWYRFRIQIESGAAETTIRARVWPDNAAEPEVYQLEAVDSGDSRLVSGTIGVWAFGPGEKRFDDLEVTLNGQPQLPPGRSFEAYGSGQDPAGWQDTGIRIDYTTMADLFRTYQVDLNKVLYTDSDLANIHAHYQPPGETVSFQTWTAYRYTGRMQITDAVGGIGLTFFSRYPNAAAYYSLRRSPQAGAAFQLIGYPETGQGKHQISQITKDAQLIPELNTWYRFRIDVAHDPDYRRPGRNDREGATFIKAKIWPEGSPEPDEFQYEGSGHSDPIKFGTVGVWSSGKGLKYYDDLRVVSTPVTAGDQALPAVLLEENFEQYDDNQDPESWLSTGKNNSRSEAPGLFRVFNYGNMVYGLRPHLSPGDQEYHTHYMPDGVDVLSWRDYIYTGRMYVAAENSGVGITFYSRYPEQRDEYYRLRRCKERPAFHLAPHPDGTNPLGGDKANAEVPTEPDTWYRFWIEVKTMDSSEGEGQTHIRAKVWPEGQSEPGNYQIQAIDCSPGRLTSGTVGIWAEGASPAYVDDLEVWHESLLKDDFEFYQEGQTPNNWQDTGEEYSLEAQASLFKVIHLDDHLVFGTKSSLNNVHTHFIPNTVPMSTLSDYTYTGRMRLADENGGLGLTFFSQYPERATYYSLRRLPQAGAAFQLIGYPETDPGSRHISQITRDARVIPELNCWYHFRIEVSHDPNYRRSNRNDQEGATFIKAKIWPEGSPEPDEFHYEASDHSAPIQFGTVGVWTTGSGAKYFDDLKVSMPKFLLKEDFTGYNVDQKPVGWLDTQARSRYEVDEALFKTREFDDNLPRWRMTDRYPLWLNPLALKFDGQQYLAAAGVAGSPPDAFTIEAWVLPLANQANPILSQGHSLKRQPRFWFGLDQDNKLNLTVVLDESGEPRTISGSAAVSQDQFTHVAVSVAGSDATFYVAGQADGEPQPLESRATLSGPDLEIGRNMAGELFAGYIREVRVWQGARTAEQIAAGLYQSGARILTGQRSDLICYWPFPETEGLYALNAVANTHHLRRGGLDGARQPDLVETAWQPEEGFWRPDRLVLVFNGSNDTIRWQGGETDDWRRRRSVAVWFRVEDKNVSSRKQVIYHEGIDQAGLLIYVYAGCLYFGGYNEPAWPGTWLETDRIESGRWHQALIVLDGRPNVRRGAFQVFLDGRLVEAGPGAQLGNYAHNLSLGGIADPVRFHDNKTIAAGTDHFFKGQMMELRIWNKAFTAEEVSRLYQAYFDPAKNTDWEAQHRVLWWQFEQADLGQKCLPNQAGGGQAVQIDSDSLRIDDNHSGLQPVESRRIYRLPQTRLDKDTLAGLARIKKLGEQYRLPVDRLTSLWFSLKHMGREVRQTLFDQVFNWQDNAAARWSPYPEPVRWQVDGQSNLPQDRAIRGRLTGALRLSEDQLNQLAAALNGPEAGLVVLDRSSLNRLYRLATVPRALGLSLEEYTRLLVLLDLKEVDSPDSLLSLSEQVARLNDMGLNVAIWDFLANDVQSSRASVHFNEAALRDLADELRRQKADFLATPDSFVSDEINQFQSMQIFDLLKTKRSVIGENGAVIPEYAQASGLEELAQDPAWQADLAALAAAQNWRAELDAALAAGLQWRVDLDKGLTQLGLTGDLIGQMLRKLQGHGLIQANGLILTSTISDADLKTAFAADLAQGPLQLPGAVSLAAIRQLLVDGRATQQAFLQEVGQKLQTGGFIDSNGLVQKATLAELNEQALRDLWPGSPLAEPPGSHLLAGIRDALSRRKTIQDQISGTLLRLRRAYDNSILVALSTLLGADADVTGVVLDHFKAEMPPDRFLALMLDLQDEQSLPPELTAIPSGETGTPQGYLYKLSKLLFLANQFELSAAELAALLQDSAAFEVKNAIRPNLDDLDYLHGYRQLRLAFGEKGSELVDLFRKDRPFSQATSEAGREQILDKVAAVTGWDRQQLGALAGYFGPDEEYNRISGLRRLKQAFDLAQSIGTDIQFLIQLAGTANLDFNFYRRQADALLNVLRAQSDEENWPRIYKPLRDRLAVQKRAALLSLALLKIPAEFEGRRSPDVLSEYLLIDMQTGSEVDTSPIQQAIASVQLYVQRCLMNLEKGVDPAWIPAKQWEWMKNYRVWEANRKVFLYPENYIEPELRDTKTPFFIELEQELMQMSLDRGSIERAYNHYLDRLIEISNLKIVGSYLHTELDNDGTIRQETLYLVGRTQGQAKTYYYRVVEIAGEPDWRRPWQKIDLAIDADHVTPIYAFGKLFLFWPEHFKSTKTVSRRPRAEDQTDIAAGRKVVDDEGYLVNPRLGERVQENIDVYKAVVKYSYYDLNQNWVPPQTFKEVEYDLTLEEQVLPQWQRVYAQRSHFGGYTLAEDFETYEGNQHPAIWLAEKEEPGDRQVRDNTLFKTKGVDNIVLATSQSGPVHSLYNAKDALNWTDYLYTGRLYLADREGGIGVMFFSRHPDGKNQSYFLRCDASSSNFYLASSGAGELTFEKEATVGIAAGSWHWFKVEVINDKIDNKTRIRASVWQDGQPEPAEFQLEAHDSNQANRLTSGTVGVWATGQGEKYFDDLRVMEIPQRKVEENVEVLQISQDTQIMTTIPKFDMNQLTWEFWVKVTKAADAGTVEEAGASVTLFNYGDSFKGVISRKTAVPTAEEAARVTLQHAEEALEKATAALNIVQMRIFVKTDEQLDNRAREAKAAAEKAKEAAQMVKAQINTVLITIVAAATAARQVVDGAREEVKKAARSAADAAEQLLQSASAEAAQADQAAKDAAATASQQANNASLAAQAAAAAAATASRQANNAAAEAVKTAQAEAAKAQGAKEPADIVAAVEGVITAVQEVIEAVKDVEAAKEARANAETEIDKSEKSVKAARNALAQAGTETGKANKAVQGVHLAREQVTTARTKAGKAESSDRISAIVAAAEAVVAAVDGVIQALEDVTAVSAARNQAQTLKDMAKMTAASDVDATKAEQGADKIKLAIENNTADLADTIDQVVTDVVAAVTNVVATVKDISDIEQARLTAEARKADVEAYRGRIQPRAAAVADQVINEADTVINEADALDSAADEAFLIFFGPDHLGSRARPLKDSANLLKTKAEELVQLCKDDKPDQDPEPFVLVFQVKNEEAVARIWLTNDQWHHLAITLDYDRQSVNLVLYRKGSSKEPASEMFKLNLDILPAEAQLFIGPRPTETNSQVFQVQLSDFRLWDRLKTPNDIAQNRDERKSGREFGLFYLPLDKQMDSSTMSLVPSELDFFQPSADVIPIEACERIIMFFGDAKKAVSSNFEGEDFVLQQLPPAIQAADSKDDTGKVYDLDLSLTVLQVVETKGLSINDYASGRTSTVSRIAPLNWPAALAAAGRNSPGELRDALDEWLDNLYERHLNSDSFVLGNLSRQYASLIDVNNRPGWYILDTGEEHFLIRADVAPDHLQTTEQLTNFAYGNKALDTDPQTILVSFNTPASLQVNSDSTSAEPPKFSFERLSTTAAHKLSETLLTEGIEALLSLDSQRTGEINFRGRYRNRRETNDPERWAAPLPSDTIDFQGSYGIYYKELFFHIPFLIANKLNANQSFAEAQRWYHFIFNPTAREADNGHTKNRYWRYLPFRALEGKTLEQILGEVISRPEAGALKVYHEDPFDPHALAELRLSSYQKAVVMKYIDNLLDWGDSLFAQDTRESINEAAMLYLLGYNLLGPKPKAKVVKRFDEIGTYEDVKRVYEQGVPEFLVEMERRITVSGNGQTVPGRALASNPHSSIITSFCVPENETFIGYWDRVEDRLYKIRHSLNIEGIFRQLALFEPPIDPSVLVRAIAGGRGISGAMSDLGVSVPHYRYAYMLRKALDMVSDVIDLGSALLSAIESRDGEQLALLQNTHEKNILDLMTSIKQKEIEVAQETLDALNFSKGIIDERISLYNSLIASNLDASLLTEERTELIMKGVAQGVKATWAILKALEAGFAKIPDFEQGVMGMGPVVTTTWGGSYFSNAQNAVGDIFDINADVLNTAAEMTGKMGEYIRRRDGWEFERKIAVEYELKQIEREIRGAEIQQQIAEEELRIHRKSIEQNRQIEDFYRGKFSNQALYNWMAGRLSGLYFQAYQLAYDMAKSAEKALQYELPTTETFISFGHWDSLKKGLLAGEALKLELNRMEKYHLAQDSRFLEISKTISMRREMPDSLLALIAGGVCDFQLTELMFDRDYPGHYFRVIKTMGLTIKAEMESYQLVKATLIQVSSKTLLTPDIPAVRYLLGDEGAQEPSSNVVRTNWRANQQVAISGLDEDLGMFSLDFIFDDRYFPFEGTGAVSTWRLEMPHQTNPDIDFTKIEDVIIHLRYTAKSDSGQFREEVKRLSVR